MKTRFSRRERAYIALIMAGFNDRMIAEQTEIGRTTVKNVVHQAMSKVGAVNRVDLITAWLIYKRSVIARRRAGER